MAGSETRRAAAGAFARKAGRIMFVPLVVLLAGLLVLVGLLLLWSPGKPRPYVGVDGKPLPGSLSEKVFVNINGVDQGMFIKSKDVTHPVLLYLHGGMPDYFLTQHYPTGLEDIFTVVWWERRGSGLSYQPGLSPDTLTEAQFISDTLTITNYLRERFGQDKIYLMGHSGGSFIAIQAAARAPELYAAYIGMAQMSNQFRSEISAYNYMLQQFRQQGNTGMVRRLETAPVTLAGGVPAAYLAVRDEAMHQLGIGTTHDMSSVITGLFLPSLTSREYTLPEKLNLWRAKKASGVTLLWEQMLSTDLSQKVPALAVPVYFMEGIYDYTCAYSEARAYFETLQAPLKGFYTFEQSAHSPMFEEPEKTRQILRQDVLAGVNTLADGQ